MDKILELEQELRVRPALSNEYNLFKYDGPQDGQTHYRITVYPIKEFDADTLDKAVSLTLKYVKTFPVADEQGESGEKKKGRKTKSSNG